MKTRKIVFLLTQLLLMGFLARQALLSSEPEIPRPWETVIDEPSGSPTEQARAVTLLEQESEQLQSLLEELKKLEEERPGSGEEKPEDLTDGLGELKQSAQARYPDADLLLKNLQEVERRWRLQAERILSREGVPPWNIAAMPKFLQSAYITAAGTAQAELYRALYEQTFDLYQANRNARLESWQLQTLQTYQQTSALHQLRSLYLRVLIDDLERDEPLQLDRQGWQDIGLEYRLIGHRYQNILAVKRVTFNQLAADGLLGWIEILSQIGRLLMAVLLPFLVYSVLRMMAQRLLAQNEDKRPSRILRLLFKLLPWLASLYVLKTVEQSFIGHAGLAELAILPGIACYFIYYRIGLDIGRAVLSTSTSRLLRVSGTCVKRKVERTVRVAGGFWVALALCLFLVRGNIGYAILYWQFAKLSSWLYLLLFLAVGWYWRPILPQWAGTLLGSNASRKVEGLCDPRKGWLFAPVIFPLLLVFALSLEVGGFFRRFEWFNQLLAQVYRQGTRETTEVVEAAPLDYIDQFRSAGSGQDTQVFLRAYRDCSTLLEDFISTGTTSTTIVLLGPRGSGKDTFQDRLVESFADRLQVNKVEFGKRLATREEFARGLSKRILDEEVDSLDSLLEKLDDEKPRLLLFADAHNLFLSSLGGFEALRALEAVACMPNILVSVAFEPYGWKFLCGAMMGALEDTFTVTLDRLQPSEIRDFILARHRKTGYSLIYDSNVFADSLDSDDSLSLENAYFQLLWDASDGTPGIAEEIWLNRLELLGPKLLRARIPSSADFSLLSNLSENALFLLSSTYRHHTLTAAEAALSTDLSQGLAERVYRMAEQKGLVVKTSQGFRISSPWQAPLARYLRRKNHLYGR